MKIKLFTLALIISITNLFGQTDSIRNGTHIFWSEDYTITFNDFSDTTKSERNVMYCEKYNICWGAYTGLFSVMDVPKKKKDKLKKEEEIYFAPAFEVSTSYRFNSDSLEYEQQKIVFDMYEIAARKCRMELDSIYNTNPSIGIRGIFFKSIEADVEIKLSEMVRDYTQEVYIRQVKGSFEKWRLLIDRLLDQTKEYKTSTSDRLRFITDQPIIDGYVRAKRVTGNLFD